MSAPQAFPLQWPAGKPRTPAGRRERGRFSKRVTKTFGRSDGSDYSYSAKSDITLADSIRRLQAELDRLGARMPVVSTNLELRLDGLPRGGQRKPNDPGAAVYFQLRGKPIVLACDHYDTVEANIAAIAAHIDAMRAMERHGVGSLEQMFAGFTALPPAMSPDDWREPLGHPTTLEQAEANYRDRMKYAHPDVNPSDAAGAVAAKLNAAIAAARAHFKT
jgi:hypothetical protein